MDTELSRDLDFKNPTDGLGECPPDWDSFKRLLVLRGCGVEGLDERFVLSGDVLPVDQTEGKVSLSNTKGDFRDNLAYIVRYRARGLYGLMAQILGPAEKGLVKVLIAHESEGVLLEVGYGRGTLNVVFPDNFAYGFKDFFEWLRSLNGCDVRLVNDQRSYTYAEYDKEVQRRRAEDAERSTPVPPIRKGRNIIRLAVVGLLGALTGGIVVKSCHGHHQSSSHPTEERR